jgi:hypothetical protein
VLEVTLGSHIVEIRFFVTANTIGPNRVAFHQLSMRRRKLEM